MRNIRANKDYNERNTGIIDGMGKNEYVNATTTNNNRVTTPTAPTSNTIVANNEKLIAGKYRLLKKIGSGSFGMVYHGLNISNNREVAIKIEFTGLIFSQLSYESKIYNILSDGKHVPYAKLYNTSEHEEALVIDLLGPSLEDLFAFCDRKFSMKTVCMLADQMITVIEYLHQNSIVHCDIKPDNFLMGLEHQSNRVFIIDFGLSKQYLIGPNRTHVKYNNNRSLTGTARYVSINTHVGITQSRRDDLESIGYVLVYFCIKCLPWQGIECRGRRQKYDRICEKKLSTPVRELCKNLPVEFNLYINYCRHLRFDETPDYSFIRSLFRSLLKSRDEKYDLCFDWLTPKYTDPFKEYLVNLSPSLYNTMSSRGALQGVLIGPLVTSRLKQQHIDEATFLMLRSEYLLSFFSRYQYLDPKNFGLSIKNFYRSYLMVPPEAMTPVENILRGLQSSTHSPYNAQSGFTANRDRRILFPRSNLQDK